MYIGVDACDGGWTWVRLDGDEAEWDTEETFEEVYDENEGSDLVLVDVPIGLPDEGRRDCDVEAKDLLGCRGASVFYTPPKKAVEASDREQADSRVEVGIQPPAWGIRDSILEVDEFIDSSLPGDVRETHPEVCFFGLSGRPMAYSKKDEGGLNERIQVLSDYGDDMGFDPRELTQATEGDGSLSKDDILDALVAAVTALLGSKRGFEVLGGENRKEIVYFKDAEFYF